MKNIRVPLIGFVPSKVPVIHLPKPTGAASTPPQPQTQKGPRHPEG